MKDPLETAEDLQTINDNETADLPEVAIVILNWNGKNYTTANCFRTTWLKRMK